MNVLVGHSIHEGPERDQLEAAVQTLERIFSAKLGSRVVCGTILMLCEDTRVAAVPWNNGGAPEPEHGAYLTETLCATVLARGLE